MGTNSNIRGGASPRQASPPTGLWNRFQAWRRQRRHRVHTQGLDLGPLPGPWTFVSYLDDPSRSRYRIRLIPPGEATGWRVVPMVILMFLTRGLYSAHSKVDDWTVRVSRQRGPWRGFATVVERRFSPGDAAALGYVEDLRARIERGDGAD